jgi:hypothetical protein
MPGRRGRRGCAVAGREDVTHRPVAAPASPRPAEVEDEAKRSLPLSRSARKWKQSMEVRKEAWNGRKKEITPFSTHLFFIFIFYFFWTSGDPQMTMTCRRLNPCICLYICISISAANQPPSWHRRERQGNPRKDISRPSIPDAYAYIHTAYALHKQE